MRNTTRKLIGAVTALAVMAGAGGAIAALVGVLPMNPRIVFAGGNTLINGGQLTVNSLPVVLTTGAGVHLVTPVMSLGYEEMVIDIQVDGACNLAGGAAAEDFRVVGEVDIAGDVRSGTLLLGEVTDFGFLDAGGTDLFDFRVTVTGGELADLYLDQDIGILLQAESSSFGGTCDATAMAEAKGTLGAVDPVMPAQGCTPGYWKQKHHFDSWVGYDPTDSFDAVFGRTTGYGTLKDALKQGGGGLKALARHATAALLNASSGDVNYAPDINTVAEVIAAFQAAFDSGDYEPTKDVFEAANEEGCPLK